MGRDKRLLVWRGRTLLEGAVDLLEEVCEEVLFVSHEPPPIPLAARQVADRFPDMGVLGGLHAALTEARREHVLCIAADTPLLTPVWLRFLAERSLAAGVPCVPRSGGRVHPLPGCYTRSALVAMEEVLRSGGGAAHRLLPRLGAIIVSEAEARAAGCPPERLANVNTPDDWRSLMSSNE
jgi:molybdopterin-guanine dinucleotide biosynthesis protein A